MGRRILPDNIEKSGFRSGEFVGYPGAFGSIRIRKGGKGWETYNHGASYGYRTARTLMELGGLL
jgi:hypothetical protein